VGLIPASQSLRGVHFWGGLIRAMCITALVVALPLTFGATLVTLAASEFD